MKLLTLLGGVLLTIAMAGPAHCDPALKVRYDGKQDRLTVQAENASLQKILAVLSLQSGIEVSMAPAAEKKVTLNLVDQPLEEGLKQMARELNLSQALYYSSRREAEGQAPLLIGMKVVPTGNPEAVGEAADATAADAKAVVNLEQEAVFRSRSTTVQEPSPEDPHGNYTRLRWQDRLASLPETRRTEVETLMQTLMEKKAWRQEAIQATREKRRAEREMNREEKEQRRELHRQNR